MTNLRHYPKKDTIVFCRSRDPFGELQNMTSGYPIEIRSHGVTAPTSEHLYQALKFPHFPVIQEAILDARNGYAAKLVANEHMASETVWPEFFPHRVKIMGFCIGMKTLQHLDHFKPLLLGTGDKPLVEYSKKDSFWGAEPVGDEFIGTNALGRLWMEIRDDLRHGRHLTVWKRIEPVELRLLGKVIDLTINAN